MKIRKLLVLILIFVLSLSFLTACKDDKVQKYAEYFNDFSSATKINSLTPSLILPDGVTVTSYYNASCVYIIEKTYVIGEAEYTRYGFCSSSEVLITPCYTHVVDIRGDYALVVKTIASGANTYSRLGLVKFRGDNIGREYGFSYSYAYAISQYTFLNDNYVVVLGDLDYTDEDNSASSTGTYTYATIYDYTSANGESLLELGRVGNVNNETTFVMQDHILVAMNSNLYQFYDTSAIKENGGFNLLQTYIPYSTDDGYTASYVTCNTYYIGNDWFILSSYYSVPDTEPEYYEMIKEDEDNEVTYYITIRSTKYNPVTNRFLSCDRVVLVANEYTQKYINELADSANVDEIYYDEDDYSKFEHYYATPVLPVSSMIKKGYSLVYYYYYVFSAGVVTGSYSFCIMDEYANVVDTKDLLFPLISVDGVALQTADPNFDMPFLDATYYNLNGETTTLEKMPVETDSEGGEKKTSGYYLACANDGMVLSYNFSLKTFTTMLGAYNTLTDTQGVPYEYGELSFFVGGYATGTQYEVTNVEKEEYVRHYYRVSKTGENEEITDCVAMKNGVYLTRTDSLFGLKSNDGTVLLAENYLSISVVENFLVENKYMKSTIFATEKNASSGAKRGVIFEAK